MKYYSEKYMKDQQLMKRDKNKTYYYKKTKETLSENQLLARYDTQCILSDMRFLNKYPCFDDWFADMVNRGIVIPKNEAA